MTLAFYVVCGLAACALVAATFAATADAYPNLPDKVPLHIGPDGCVNGRGPRAFIWMLPLVQLVTMLLVASAIAALALGVPGTHGSPRGAGLIGLCVVALLWRVQRLLLQVAQDNGDRVDLRGIAIWLLLFPVAIAAAIVLG